VGEDAFRRINEPVVVAGQRASALRFADPAVQALFSALLVFRLLPRGFSNRDLRDHWAPLVGTTAQSMTQGQLSYHLRRLRLHGLIERMAGTHRYRVTDSGWRATLFCTRVYNRILRPGLTIVLAPETDSAVSLRRCFDRLDAATNAWIAAQKVPA
jgi:hypothetical protein